ncbi:hypothetical protein N7523_009194 [Penicillium sp. IBT 18751x]|nr:hypothetical protein N7523_009194 [Penicillium sp. IBT 18751x]
MSSLGIRGNSLNIVAILGVLMPGIMSVGYNAASLGGVLSLKSFENQFPEIDVDHAKDQSYTSTIQGTVVAAYAVGGFLGTFSCIFLGDKLGRRWTMMTGAAVQILGCILNATASALVQLIISRITIGFGTGALLATIPLWQSEISPAKKRGRHVATKGVFSGLGCALALFLEFGMSFMGSSVAWRFPSAFPVLLSAIVFVFAALLPDSPRWLLRQGRVTEAREVLAILEDTCVDDGIIDEKVKEVQDSLELSGGKRSLGQIFHMGPQKIFHRAMLAVGPLVFLQLTGATVTTFYTTSIFENNLGLDDQTSRLLAGVYQLVGPIGGTVCVLGIEGFGRRKLLMASTIGNTICLTLIASLGSVSGNLWASHGAVFFLFLFHFSYIIGFGGIPYLFATEIAPLHLRTTINSMSISISWIFSILITNVTPLAFNLMGQRYFLVFAGLNVVMTPAIYYLFPETAGRSLEEMDEIFALSRGVLDVVHVAKKLPHRHQIEYQSDKKFDDDLKDAATLA